MALAFTRRRHDDAGPPRIDVVAPSTRDHMCAHAADRARTLWKLPVVVIAPAAEQPVVRLELTQVGNTMVA
jgi:hypothetical protein